MMTSGAVRGADREQQPAAGTASTSSVGEVALLHHLGRRVAARRPRADHVQPAFGGLPGLRGALGELADSASRARVAFAQSVPSPSSRTNAATTRIRCGLASAASTRSRSSPPGAMSGSDVFLVGPLEVLSRFAGRRPPLP
jgi:hypothetical protein